MKYITRISSIIMFSAMALVGCQTGGGGDQMEAVELEIGRASCRERV